jgi:transcriptional antiterminator NusG
MDTKSWFAIQVLASREKRVHTMLTYKGYEVLLPLYKTVTKWSDRYKESERALFPGYLFARFDPNLRLPIIATSDILQIVGFGNRPVQIPEDEIDAIQILVSSHAQASPHPYLRVGEKVMITEGPLAGMFGMLARAKTALRLVITIELLQRSVAVEVDANSVRPVRTTTLPGTGLLIPLAAKC